MDGDDAATSPVEDPAMIIDLPRGKRLSIFARHRRRWVAIRRGSQQASFGDFLVGDERLEVLNAGGGEGHNAAFVFWSADPYQAVFRIHAERQISDFAFDFVEVLGDEVDGSNGMSLVDLGHWVDRLPPAPVHCRRSGRRRARISRRGCHNPRVIEATEVRVGELRYRKCWWLRSGPW